MKKISILLSLVFFILYAFINYKYLVKYDLSDKFNLFLIAIDITMTLVIVLIIGLIGSSILSKFIIKTVAYKKRMKLIIPHAILTIIAVMLIGFAHAAYLQEVKGIPFQKPRNYNEIIVPDDLNCSSLHFGEFETDRAKIIRKENRQIEVEKSSGNTEEFQITWISACEYTLNPVGNDSLKIYTKIIFTNNELYRCFSIPGEHLNMKPILLTIKKIK